MSRLFLLEIGGAIVVGQTLLARPDGLQKGARVESVTRLVPHSSGVNSVTSSFEKIVSANGIIFGIAAADFIVNERLLLLVQEPEATVIDPQEVLTFIVNVTTSHTLISVTGLKRDDRVLSATLVSPHDGIEDVTSAFSGVVSYDDMMVFKYEGEGTLAPTEQISLVVARPKT